MQIRNKIKPNDFLVIHRVIVDWPSLGIYADRPETHRYALKSIDGTVIAEGTKSEIDSFVEVNGIRL